MIRVVRRFADPFWVQSLGCVAGFDWNASGLTTTLTAAIKLAVAPMANDLGWTLCGGKGATSRKTPEEIKRWAARWGMGEQQAQQLIQASRLTAKVDNALIQDGFQIYHHAFILTRDGHWAVMQQGMNTERRRARRYHWATTTQFLNDPHTAIQTTEVLKQVLNMAARDSEQNRRVTVEWLQHPASVWKDLKMIERVQSRLSRKHTYRQGQLLLFEGEVAPIEFHHHPVERERFFRNPYFQKLLQRIVQEPPRSYPELMLREGVGPASIRALALVAEVLYGARPSYRDPARYSFAHGGKDGTPYPVHRRRYDQTLDLLRKAIARVKSASWRANAEKRLTLVERKWSRP